MFPPEILEKILYYCDGRTLNNAKRVNTTWRKMVEYVSEKTEVWKHCCFKDIPQHEIMVYSYKWVEDKNTAKIKWQKIYDNWLAWHDIKRNINFEHIASCDTPRITCLTALCNYIVIGLENGIVKIFDSNLTIVMTFGHLNISVVGVTLIADDASAEPTELLVCYGNGTIFVNDFVIDSPNEPVAIYDCPVYSIFKKFICGVAPNGKISVMKITTDSAKRKMGYDVITHLRIYSPARVTCCSIWDGICTILVNNKVKIFLYDEKNTHLNRIATFKADLNFLGSNYFGFHPKCQIYNNDIIIALSVDSVQKQIIEFFIMAHDDSHSKKMFSPWTALNANITCMYLYGNTFVIGADSGAIYFYHITDWKQFNIRQYKHKEVISQAPILGIDSIEMIGRRVFYIATTFDLHQYIGFNNHEPYTTVSYMD